MNEHDIEAREVVRQSRTPAQGSRLTALSGGGDINTISSASSTRIGNDGKVRRLWIPGDPWTDDYYFGSED